MRHPSGRVALVAAVCAAVASAIVAVTATTARTSATVDTPDAQATTRATMGTVDDADAGRLGVMAAATTPTAAPLPVTTGPIVWVDARVDRSWPVASAARFVDRYTGTRMVFGRCHAGARCVVIREDSGLPAAWGAATWPGYPTTRIRLNPQRRHTSSTQRLHILVHELGHARGIYQHATSCTSIMYASVTCPNGRYAPLLFTTAQRRVLRAH